MKVFLLRKRQLVICAGLLLAAAIFFAVNVPAAVAACTDCP